MKKFNILEKIDGLAPTPWIVDGYIQKRPVEQLAFFCGVVIGIFIVILFF